MWKPILKQVAGQRADQTSLLLLLIWRANELYESGAGILTNGAL